MATKHVFGRLAGEPLLQFTLLGALLFVVDQAVSDDMDDPRRIVIDAQKRQELAAIFEEGQGNPPSPEELQALIITWSQNEVLYREARLMGLDQGDEMIRQRLILKMRNVVFGNVVVGSPSEADLRSHFAAHRAQYDRPETFDFEQFQVGDRDQAGALAAQLESALGTGPAPAKHVQAVRRYQARPQANLVDLFGQDDIDKLLERPDGTWVAITSDRAFHMARITRRHPPQPANFEQSKSQVARAWKEAARQASLAASLKAIAEQYDIRVTPDARPSVAGLSRSPSRAEAPRERRR